MVKSGQVWAGSFATTDSTGALLASTSAPTAALYVNGVSNAAAVTVTGSNPYKWSVTLPALTAGDTVEIYASATIATIPVSQFVAAATADTSRPSDVYARIGAPAGASVSADVLQVKNYVDDIGAAGAGLTALPWNAAWDAEVQSEATDALNAYDPPTNTEMEARTLPTASYFDPATDTVTPSGGTINSVTGSIGGDVAGKVLGGGSGTITGVGTSANVTYSAGVALTGRLAQASDLAALGNAGLYSYSATVDDGANPLDGVFVQCATDAGFTNVIGTTYSNASGAYTVRSDQAGAHYLRFQLAGWNFSDETVTLA